MGSEQLISVTSGRCVHVKASSSRLSRSVLATLTLSALLACHGQSAPVAPTTILSETPRDRVRVVLTNNAAFTVFQARLQGDSIVGHRGDSSMVARRPNTPITIPLAQVQHLTVTRTDPGRTFLAIIVIPAVILGITVLVAAGGCSGGGYSC